MDLQLSLCRHYMTQDEGFWNESLKAFSFLREQTFFIDSLHRLQAAVTGRNLEDAQLICDGCVSMVLEHTGSKAMSFLAPCLLLALCLPQGLETLRKSGADEHILVDTFSDFSRWESRQYKETGLHGIEDAGWLLYPYVGRLFQIGRLQYEPHLFSLPYAIYRNRDGRTLCLCLHELPCDSRGFLSDSDRPPNAGFMTTFSRSGEKITATASDLNSGIFLKTPVTINAGEWELLLAYGQPSISLHIPRCGHLSPDSVDESLTHAKSFFSTEDHPLEIIVCDSWLLDPALYCLTNPSDNIRSFMQRFHKYPVFPDSTALEYLFEGNTACGPEHLQAKTSLQKNVIHFLREGGTLHDTGGFLLL